MSKWHSVALSTAMANGDTHENATVRRWIFGSLLSHVHGPHAVLRVVTDITRSATPGALSQLQKPGTSCPPTSVGVNGSSLARRRYSVHVLARHMSARVGSRFMMTCTRSSGREPSPVMPCRVVPVP